MEHEKSKKIIFQAIAATTISNITLVAISIFIAQSYGFALFLAIPFLNGFINGYWLTKKLKQVENPNIYINILASVFFSTIISGILLIVVGVEGLICTLMAMPIFLIVSLIIGYISYSIFNLQNKKIQNAAWIFALLSFPTGTFIDKITEPTLHQVQTEMIINAPIQKVWQNVIIFSPMEEPTEFIFKSGISYPINATIKGEGVGAIRYCTFNTGSFVEPITAWNEPTLLAFDVEEQPIPLKELSFWDIDAPHLHDFFVSKNGRFDLEEIGCNTTKLTGTTWYYHKIKPAFYWKWWSNSIIHTIHNRVLSHIKTSAENDN